jgi:hypothetical protein
MCSLDSDDSSIDCEMNGLSEGKRSEDKQIRFLNLLIKWPVVLNKCQIPAVKGEKRPLQELCKSYAQIFGEEITNVKISKQINNIKTETVL